ncbi:MAG: tRNA (guanosine(46)-N7)-methyltransferase TrmB [Bacteroidales bacterium]|nr:tRNA (guanosine(46)-N7)-methyltransferase TrmB [Bacteroidales bacterium]
MSKNKLAKFADMATFANVVQPVELTTTNFGYKGKWSSDFFHNNHPITLELGCGKGEYTVALSQACPSINFIGVDIKGARIWNGAKKALEANITNAGFLRTRIDMIDNFFGAEEVSEVWITFPDPQPKKQNKRLTSAYFLNQYRKFLKNGAVVNLKTDSRLMHFYTLQLLKANNIEPLAHTDDLYNSPILDDTLSIKTYYENMFLQEGKRITYLKFSMDINKEIVEIPKFEFLE